MKERCHSKNIAIRPFSVIENISFAISCAAASVSSLPMQEGAAGRVEFKFRSLLFKHLCYDSFASANSLKT